MDVKIALLAGDGIGPEIVAQGVAVLEAVAKKFGHEFDFVPALIGGAAAPVVIPIIAAGHGFGFAIGCVACIYVVAFIAMFFLPEKKGSALE